jgi:hypothetical protein
MKSKVGHELFNHPLFWVLQCVLAIGFIVVPHGIGLTHDSAMYVFAARKLVETQTLLDPSGNPMVLYPPLYPALLSVGIGLKIPVQLWALALNVIAHAAIVLLVKSETTRFKHKGLVYSLLLVIVYGMPLIQNAVFVWADSVFIALLLGVVVTIRKFIETNQFIYFLFSFVLAIAAIYDRFIGVAIVAAACLQLVLFTKHLPSKRWWHAIMYGMICLMGFLLWEYRNLMQSGVTNHPYDPGIFSWTRNGFDIFSILGSYWVPGNLPAILRFTVAFLFMAVGIALLYTNRRILFDRKDTRFQQDFFWFCSISSYLLFFGTLNTLFFICEWDDRYLSPCYPFICLLFFKWIDEYADYWFRSSWVTLLAIVLLFYPMGRYFKNAFQWRNHGIGFNNQYWFSNRLLRWVKASEPGIYISNNSMPIIIPGNKECYFMPLKFSQPVTLVWWNDENKLNYVDWKISELDTFYNRTEGPEFKEGRIYFLTPKK